LSSAVRNPWQKIERLGPGAIEAVSAELAKPKNERQPLEFTFKAWIADQTVAEFPKKNGGFNNTTRGGD
jgi:hypothetical protein